MSSNLAVALVFLESQNYILSHTLLMDLTLSVGLAIPVEILLVCPVVPDSYDKTLTNESFLTSENSANRNEILNSTKKLI